MWCPHPVGLRSVLRRLLKQALNLTRAPPSSPWNADLAEFALLSTFCSPGITSQACYPPGSVEQEHVCFLSVIEEIEDQSPQASCQRRGTTAAIPGGTHGLLHPQSKVFLRPAISFPTTRLLLLLCSCCPDPTSIIHVSCDNAPHPRPPGSVLALHNACLSNTPALSSLHQPPSVAPHCPSNKIHPFHGPWALNDSRNFSSTQCLVSLWVLA